jgi:hypothetical protein
MAKSPAMMSDDGDNVPLLFWWSQEGSGEPAADFRLLVSRRPVLLIVEARSALRMMIATR